MKTRERDDIDEPLWSCLVCALDLGVAAAWLTGLFCVAFVMTSIACD